MKRPRLRLLHLLGLVAAAAAFFAVVRYRQGVYDPAAAQARRLRSYDPAVRLDATAELAKMGREAESAIPTLLGALDDGDPRVRARAASVLVAVVRGRADHPRAGDIRAALTVALADPDPGARRAAAVALGMFQDDPKVVPHLIEAAGDTDPRTRRQAVSALGGFDDEAARGVVLAAVHDSSIEVRVQALHALNWKPRAERFASVREAVAPALKDENPIVRGAAVLALGRYAITVQAGAPEVFDALADPDPYVRRMACTFLPNRPESRPAVSALIRALGDPEMEVRYAAADRLRRIGLDAEEALAALRTAADDKEETVRKFAADAIRSIEAKANDFRTKLLPGALEDLASPDPDVRRGAAETLARFGPHSAPAVPALIRCLGDGDPTVRLASALALGRLGPVAREALPALCARSTDPDERVRRAAAAVETAIRSQSGQ